MLLSTAAGGLTDAGIEFEQHGDVEIGGVVHHTGSVLAGTLFCCVPGSRFDGHDHAEQVVAAGAAALLVERNLPLDVPQIVVPSVRFAMGPLAARFWGDPSRAMTVVGVTGTNGKTTTVSLLRSIFERAGKRCEVVGTLTSLPGGPPTTPDAPELQAQLAAWRDVDVDVVAMEVSSHALAMGRVDGTWFEATGFTMLGHDHLDLHLDLDHYFEAKARLFEPARTRRAVIRSDDEWGARLIEKVRSTAPTDIEIEPFSLDDASELESTPAGMRFGWRDRHLTIPMAGRHNVANALCAATLASWLGVADEHVDDGLAAVGPVRGRFEPVVAGQDFTLVVDYAHTPDALETVLAAARELADGAPGDDVGRVIVVFGCGGDKDRAKRPEMGRVAADGSDVVIITSDNPRSEDPLAIIDEILAGVSGASGVRPSIDVVADRRDAIHHAARAARNHDVVVVAGKGHETTQTFADRTIAFDDSAVAREAIDAVVAR
ncbi:MAG: UDP-N-acetylmuramoyl-L-alanyl-D-glutamate--2,6-diaminopimelate ligase [Acidimicrobiales bacterium]|nr:UDP-N-acetylmuramoyl-L-alanyl-D-glutamate--2,6-diaminopimelate ligase [Acidimicrobiales bacterium]